MAEPPKPPPKRPQAPTVPRMPPIAEPAPRRADPRAEPSAPRFPAVGNVPVPSGLRPSHQMPAAGEPSSPPSSARGDFLLRSMAPPVMYDDEGEDTRVGATIVGAPAYRPAQQAASTKMAYLTVIAGNRAGEMFKLDGEETVLGRGPQSAVHLDSDGVSRKHARVVRQGDEYIVEDLKSTNGTWVDDKRITFHKLKDGDRVQVGTEVIVRFNLHDEMEAALQQQLYESAVRDPLTGAYNRKHFAERMRAELAHAARHKTTLSLIILDIDFFKKVNDTHGHPAGDAVLRAIASAIQKVIRVEDVFARIGGEEFALVARGIDGPNGSLFAERLRKGIERMQVPWNGGTIPVSASFGVATFTELADPRDGDGLISLADQRLYQAKSGGRNRVVGPAA